MLLVIQAVIEKRNEYIEAGGKLEDEISITAASGELNFDTIHVALREAIRLDQAEERREREEARAMAARFAKKQPTLATRKKSAGRKEAEQRAKDPKAANLDRREPTRRRMRRPATALRRSIVTSRRDLGTLTAHRIASKKRGCWIPAPSNYTMSTIFRPARPRLSRLGACDGKAWSLPTTTLASARCTMAKTQHVELYSVLRNGTAYIHSPHGNQTEAAPHLPRAGHDDRSHAWRRMSVLGT